MFGNNNFFQEFFQETILKSIESVFLNKTSVEKFKEDVFKEFRLFNLKKIIFIIFISMLHMNHLSGGMNI